MLWIPDIKFLIDNYSTVCYNCLCNGDYYNKKRGRFMSIKELRTTTGLSQSQFAKKFHIKLHTLQSWEQGVRPASETVIYLITLLLVHEGILKKECIEDDKA